MRDKIKLRLVLDVEYDPQGETPESLSEMLADIAKRAASNGQMTGDTPAEVDEWRFKVEDVTESWNDDTIQFPRLIAELEMAGVFTRKTFKLLCESMDLENENIDELLERAQKTWDKIKSET